MHTCIILVYPIPALTPEIAASFGFRDRILGIDSGEREATIARFGGQPHLEQAYYAGWIEADDYVEAAYRRRPHGDASSRTQPGNS